MAILCGLLQNFKVENFEEMECPGQNLHEACTGSSDSEDELSDRAECLPQQTRLGKAAMFGVASLHRATLAFVWHDIILSCML